MIKKNILLVSINVIISDNFNGVFYYAVHQLFVVRFFTFVEAKQLKSSTITLYVLIFFHTKAQSQHSLITCFYLALTRVMSCRLPCSPFSGGKDIEIIFKFVINAKALNVSFPMIPIKINIISMLFNVINSYSIIVINCFNEKEKLFINFCCLYVYGISN